MDIRKIKKLIELLEESDIGELEIKEGEESVERAMPRIKAAQIDRLIAAFHPTEGRAICVPTVRGKRGNPVLFATRFMPEMRQVSGDVGARHLIGAHADEVVEIEMDDDAALVDIDTPAALAALVEAAR